ncbi:hypothetical protein D3C86_1898280 [compost metagenome]
MQHERRGGVHPQAPGRLLAAHRHLLLGFLDAGEDAPRLGEKGRAFLGQLQPAGGAAQQGDAELFLQPPQRAADARGGLPELLGGGADRAAVDHAGEGLQFIERGFHW